MVWRVLNALLSRRLWPTFKTKNFSTMQKRKNNRPSGSKSEPKVVSEVLEQYLRSDEPFAAAFRNWMTEREVAKESEEDDDEDQLFRDIFPNTEPAVDLKLLTRKPGRLPVGVPVKGSIVNDGSDHFTFLQDAHKGKTVVAHRNPIVVRGTFVNVHLKADGSFYPTFNRPRFNENFACQEFFRGASSELQYFASLIKKV